MTTPLLDLALRAPSTARSIVLAESDRTRSGTSLVGIFHDPTRTSRHWAAALEAYRQIWSGYKAHAPVIPARALLAEAAKQFTYAIDLLGRADLVAAFLTVDGGELEAWVLPTALLVVRRGEDVGELGPDGLAAVAEAGPLLRGSEGGGIWHGSLEVETGASFVLLPRAAGVRLGPMQLRHALLGASAEGMLAEIGPGEDPVVVARVLRSAELVEAGMRARPVALAAPAVVVVAAPPAVAVAAAESAPPVVEPAPPVMPVARADAAAPVASAATSPPEGSFSRTDEPDLGLVLRSSRRHFGARESTWLHRLADAPAAAPPAASPAARQLEITPLPLPAPAEPDIPDRGDADLLVLPGRRQRPRTPGGPAGSSAEPASPEAYLLRRGLTWTAIGGSLVLVLVVLILLGRLLTGGGRRGPEVSELAVPRAPAPAAAAIRSATAPLPVPFAGASWTHRFSAPISSSPLVAGELLVVGCRDGNLYALGLRDGRERWRLAAGSGIGSSPGAAGPLVVVGTYKGEVIAADAASGRERWRARLGGKVVSSPAFVDPGLVPGGLVVIGSHDHHVYGLGAADGAVHWRAATAGIVWASPVVADGRVFVGSYDKSFYCLNAVTGQVIWRASTGGAITGAAAVWGDRVAVGSADGRVHAYTRADGKPVWTHPAGAAVGGPAVAAGDLVAVGTDAGDLLLLSAEDGARRARVHAGGPVRSRPAAGEGRIWFTSYDGTLRAADPASGRVEWSFPVSGRLYSSPALLGRTAFFGSMDGTVYAATWPSPEEARP